MIGTAAASGLFAVKWLVFDHALPQRFPPTMAWILGPALILYLYTLACHYGIQFVGRIPFVLTAGRNVLFFLLASNLAIFTLKGNQPGWSLSTGEGLAFTVLLLAVIRYAASIIGNQSSQNRWRLSSDERSISAAGRTPNH